MEKLFENLTISKEIPKEIFGYQLCSKCDKNPVKVPAGSKSLSFLCPSCARGAEIIDLTLEKIKPLDVKSIMTTSPAKHEDFIRLPLDMDLTSVPGIGRKGGEALAAVGIVTTWQLIGKYMFYGPGTDGANRFRDFLSQFTCFARTKDTITRAIAEKCSIAFGTF